MGDVFGVAAVVNVVNNQAALTMPRVAVRRRVRLV